MKTNKTLKDFLQIKNETEKALDLYFYGEIVACELAKWCENDKYPQEITNFLNTANGRDLNIYINSGGGNVFAGMAIYSMLKRYEGNTTAYIDGVAASIASVIPFACKKIIMPKNAYLMIHKPILSVQGNANELAEAIDILNRIEQGIVDTYAEHLRAGVKIETIKEYMQGKGKWFTAIEASNIFNLELAEENKAVAYADVSDFANIPESIKNRGDTDKIALLKAETEFLRLNRRNKNEQNRI